MWKNIGIEECQSFIACQLRSPGGPFGIDNKPAITISRMTGCGARSIAATLAEQLQQQTGPVCPWTVFDRNLVEKVLEEHYLPRWIAEYMPEAHKPLFEDTMEELLGLHPASWTLVQQTSETIWHLAKMGYVILVGRGANVITGKLASVVHVRLVGSVERRIERVRERLKLTRSEAIDLVNKEDQGRSRYLKDHFGRDINDPLLYHLILNTDQVSEEECTTMIGNFVSKRFAGSMP